MLSRNTLTLIYSGLIFAGFFVSGVLDILDLFIVKVLLFGALGVLGIRLLLIVLKDSENETTEK